MYVISAEALITNFFGEKEGENTLSISKLYEYRNLIENHINRANFCWCYIDVSEESIADCVESNSKYLSFNVDRSAVVFNRDLVEEFYMDLLGIFNSRIDKEVRYQFLEAVEHCLSEFDVNSLIGLTYGEALQQCTNKGYKACVLMINNVSFPITSDLRFDRVRFYVENNLIINAEIG